MEVRAESVDDLSRDRRPPGAPRVTWVGLREQAVLYIDDDRALLRLMARTFEQAGGHCRTAATHDDAVDALRADESVHIVVVDYEMPDGEVAHLLERLRAVRPDVALVGTSGRDHQRDFARCGVHRYLPKPWRPQQLADAIGW